MGRRKANQPYLPDWLGAAPQPVVLLDDDGAVLALNLAAEAWLKVTGKDAIGRRVHAGSASSADVIERRLAGLAMGHEPTGSVYALDEAEQPVVYRAHCLPFAAPDERGTWRLLMVGNEPAETSVPHEPAAAIAAARLELARQKTQAARAAPVFSLVGSSSSAETLRAQVQAAGTADAHLTVAGPTGGEQELVARRIHALRYARSSRQPPLTPIQCRVADQAFVQEVIRHGLAERGQFDPPLCCLLLVDVERLDRGSQAELAGFLRISPTLLRVFATANTTRRDPEEEVAATGNDPYLAAQLSAQMIRLPPLNQRRADLAAIVASVVDALSRQKGHASPALSPALVDSMTEHGWPGDFAELLATVTAMLSRAPGKPLDVGDLPEPLRHSLAAQRGGRLPVEQIDLGQLLATVEREVTGRALALCRNNRADAARHLGLSRARLLRRCGQLGIVLPGEAVEFEPVEFDEVKE